MPLLLILLWLVLEAYLVSRATAAVGLGWVLLWFLAMAALGSIVIQRQGLRAVRAVRAATASGQLPAQELLESLLAIIGGVLLIFPGLLSDIVGLGLLFAGLRRLVAARLGMTMARRRPDLQAPVTIEGEYRRTDAKNREIR
jgi:UPF0716 protein FxsA